mgnify:CR=1 FL=1
MRRFRLAFVRRSLRFNPGFRFGFVRGGFLRPAWFRLPFVQLPWKLRLRFVRAALWGALGLGSGGTNSLLLGDRTATSCSRFWSISRRFCVRKAVTGTFPAFSRRSPGPPKTHVRLVRSFGRPPFFVLRRRGGGLFPLGFPHEFKSVFPEILLQIPHESTSDFRRLSLFPVRLSHGSGSDFGKTLPGIPHEIKSAFRCFSAGAGGSPLSSRAVIQPLVRCPGAGTRRAGRRRALTESGASAMIGLINCANQTYRRTSL